MGNENNTSKEEVFNILAGAETSYVKNDDGVILNIVVQNGGFEVNEFNTANKIKNYLSNLRQIVKSKHEKEYSNKLVTVIIGNTFTFKFVYAGLLIEENDFQSSIKDIITNMNYLEMDESILLSGNFSINTFDIDHSLLVIKND